MTIEELRAALNRAAERHEYPEAAEAALRLALVEPDVADALVLATVGSGYATLHAAGAAWGSFYQGEPR